MKITVFDVSPKWFTIVSEEDGDGMFLWNVCRHCIASQKTVIIIVPAARTSVLKGLLFVA